MINNKKQLVRLVPFYSLLFPLFFSCAKKEALVFESHEFSTDFLEDCSTTDCATISINIPLVVSDNIISKAINSKIEQVVSTVLNISETDTITTVKMAISEFNREYQKIKIEFPEEITPYEVTIDGKLQYHSDQLIVIMLESYVFTAGAHGYSSTTFLNFDTSDGTLLSHSSLFKDFDAFKTLVEEFFRKKYNISNDKSINSTGFFFENDTFKLPENIGFTDSDLVFYYNQYEAAAYSEGPLELKIEREIVQRFLRFE